MKRNCNGCRASSRGFYNDYTCVLGYKVESVFSDKFVCYTHGKPLEECPKPKTYDQYMKLERKES
jgi:hypothetical protein